MEFKDIVRQRYACRQYEDRKIPEDTIQELLAIIGYSVSAINLQPWKIKVVESIKMTLGEDALRFTKEPGK